MRLALAGILSLGALIAVFLLLPRERATRIVLITLDTLRYDAFAGDSTNAAAMPVLAAEAARGVRYERCYAASATTEPTHASLFTGKHPWEHGLTRNGLVLDADLRTVAELLRAAGFETSAAVASFVMSSRFGFAQGFDRYREEEIHPDEESKGAAGYVLSPEVVDRSLELLAQATASRQFFWFHFIDAHAPYGDTVDQEWRKSTPEVRRARFEEGERRRAEEIEAETTEGRKLYLLDVAMLDRELGRLLDRLRRDRSRFETHLVVTADHGEAFGEGGLIGHGKWLGEATLRVPCFIVSPRVSPGRRTDVVGSVDFFDTILALADVPAPASGGRNLLLPPSSPTSAVGMRRSFAEPQRFVLLDGNVQILEGFQFFAVDPSGGLQVGSASELPQFASFEEQAAQHAASTVLSDAEESTLRSLGYVQ